MVCRNQHNFHLPKSSLHYHKFTHFCTSRFGGQAHLAQITRFPVPGTFHSHLVHRNLFRCRWMYTSIVTVALVLPCSLYIQQGDGYYPHGVPAMPGRSSPACRGDHLKEQTPIICLFGHLFNIFSSFSAKGIEK